jgi:sugar transport system substrate-binding protein
MKPSTWMLGVAAAGLLLAGCSKSDRAAPAAAGSAPGKTKQIALAGIVFQEDQFFRLILFGMRDAAKKAGVELYEANSNNKPEKEIELINTYVAKKVDAIIVSPLSKKGSVQALKQAYDQGVKIVANNSGIDADFAASTIESSAEDLGAKTGQAARKYIQEKLGGKAKVAILAFKSQVPEQSDLRSGGFKKEVTSLPGVEIVAEQDAWLPEMALKKAGDILTAHPDLNVIWAANEGGTIGAALAVKNAGKAGQIAVFGTDSSQQLLDMLQTDDNILQAITSQRPVDVGRASVDAALKAIRGEPVEKLTVLQGVLLSRDDPQAVKQFAAQFKEWTSQN